MTEANEAAAMPCPFCGERKHLFMEPDERGSGGQWVPPVHVGCSQTTGCGVSVIGDDADEAIAAWNRRPTITQVSQDVEPAADLDALEAAVFECANAPYFDGWLDASKRLVADVPALIAELRAARHAVSQDVPAPAAGVREAALEEAAKVADARAAVCDDAVKLIGEGKLYRDVDGAAATERCASLEARHIAKMIRALNPTGAA